MNNNPTIVQALRRLANEPVPQRESIRIFQALVWDSTAEGSQMEILRDLAYDLDFFEEDEEIRSDSPVLYGSESLKPKIEEALRRLRATGMAV